MLAIHQVADAVRRDGGMNRRLFLGFGAALSSLPLLGVQARGETAPAKFKSDPFTLGVASGDPSPDGFVLWTRLAPEPLVPRGGMPPTKVEVAWEVAEDEAFQKIARHGTSVATPQLGHSVHVELAGLKPDRWYYYRFRAGDAASPVGRTRTMPRPDATPGRMRFAFTSCQHYETGLYTAYQQMAADECDLVFHLGDYIYEGAGRAGNVRQHVGPELATLDDYRIRLSQYRSDPDLHGMHAAAPWMVTWDDHEFDNNYADLVSEEQGIDPAEFAQRRANAYQAYYEMMPLRRRSIPFGPHLQLYRRASFGRLAELIVLDDRQHRTDQPNGDRGAPLNAEALSPENSMLGARQYNWLTRSLLRSQGTWNVLAQQVMMALVDRAPGEPERFSMDQWPGYAYERARLLQFLADRQVPNPVVLTGDIHSNWANELRVDDRRPETDRVATEFVCTSLSSGGNGVDKPGYLDQLYAENPCVKYHNQERGYVRCTLTPRSWQSDYVVCEDVTKPNGPIKVRASFVVEAGRPEIHKA